MNDLKVAKKKRKTWGNKVRREWSEKCTRKESLIEFISKWLNNENIVSYSEKSWKKERWNEEIDVGINMIREAIVTKGSHRKLVAVYLYVIPGKNV